MLSDVRFGIRQFRKQLGFAITVVAVLALGIGPAAAVFSVLYDVLLKPLPYSEPDRIVSVHNWFPKSPLGLTGVSALDYMDISRHREIFSGTAAYYFNDLTMTGAGSARHVDAVNVSASLFALLGVKPELGRVITQQDDRYGAPKIAVLSDAFWRSAFGADKRVTGRTIQLDGEPVRIAGVMPRTFQFPYAATQLWIPLALSRDSFVEGHRGSKGLRMIARLHPGLTVDQANAALMAIGQRLAAGHPDFYPASEGWRFTAALLMHERTEGLRRWILLAFGLVLCVFVIACSNAGGLLLIRSTSRATEIAVRVSLGAGRYRILRQILMETALLVIGGCGAGILIAECAVRLSSRYGPNALRAEVGIRTILFAVGAAAVATIAAGILPILASWRLSPEQALKSAATRTQTSTARTRDALVAGQIALAVVLVFTAMLLSRSLFKLMQVPAGFVPEHVWTGAVDLSRRDYSRNRKSPADFFTELRERIEALPGVSSASGANPLPFNPSGFWTADLFFPGRPEPNIRPAAQFIVVMPRYFETMKIALRRGRTFSDSDAKDTAPVAVINEEFARRYFANQDPIGRIVENNGLRNFPTRVIGVVANIADRELGGPAAPAIYWLEAQYPVSSMYLVVRTRTDEDITAAVRKIITELDRGVALYDMANMGERIAKSLNLRRFIAILLNGFAAVGLVLASMGLYGSLAYLVELRRREIGIRIAIGAIWQNILAVVIRQMLSIMAAGVSIGVLGAQFAARFARNQLFGVQSYDIATCAMVIALLLLAAFFAVLLPARNAVRIQPVEALREQ